MIHNAIRYLFYFTCIAVLTYNVAGQIDSATRDVQEFHSIMKGTAHE